MKLTETDLKILKELKKHTRKDGEKYTVGLSGFTLSCEIESSERYTYDRLRRMILEGYAVKISDGIYAITNKGIEVLNEKR